MDVSKIKDWKEKNRILKAKRQVSLIKEDDVEKEMTEEEKESQNRFYNALGGD